MSSACETIHYSLITINFYFPPIDKIWKCVEISKLEFVCQEKLTLFTNKFVRRQIRFSVEQRDF
jgi:hypothetical protein